MLPASHGDSEALASWLSPQHSGFTRAPRHADPWPSSLAAVIKPQDSVLAQATPHLLLGRCVLFSFSADGQRSCWALLAPEAHAGQDGHSVVWTVELPQVPDHGWQEPTPEAEWETERG